MMQGAKVAGEGSAGLSGICSQGIGNSKQGWFWLIAERVDNVSFTVLQLTTGVKILESELPEDLFRAKKRGRR